MIEQARQSLGDEVELIVRDLVDLELEEPVDAIFSNATFHWILDHRRLFERLHVVLRPGGRLEAQCGGIGNVEDFLNSVESVRVHLRGRVCVLNEGSLQSQRAGREAPEKCDMVLQKIARVPRPLASAGGPRHGERKPLI